MLEGLPGRRVPAVRRAGGAALHDVSRHGHGRPAPRAQGQGRLEDGRMSRPASPDEPASPARRTMSTALQTSVQLPQQDIDTPLAVPTGEMAPETALAIVERGQGLREAALGWRAYAQDLARRNVIALGKDQAFLVRDGLRG